MLSTPDRAFVSVVGPDRESPGRAANEVSMILRDAKVVNVFVLVRVEDFFDRSPLAVVAGQEIARLQDAR